MFFKDLIRMLMTLFLEHLIIIGKIRYHLLFFLGRIRILKHCLEDTRLILGTWEVEAGNL